MLISVVKLSSIKLTTWEMYSLEMSYFSVDFLSSKREGSMMILKGSFISPLIMRSINRPASYPPFSTSVTMEEMGGSDKWHIISSLSTPNKDSSSGILMLLMVQICETRKAKLSSQAKRPTGFGNDSSHSSSSI